MKATTSATSNLGALAWVDASPDRRRWFAKWLLHHGTRIYFNSLSQLTGKDYDRAYAGLEEALKGLARRLPNMSTADQLAVLDAAARGFGLNATREELLEELRFYLIHSGDDLLAGEAFRASPWCNYHAIEQHVAEQFGQSIIVRHYPKDDPRDADMRLALEDLIEELSPGPFRRDVSLDFSRLASLHNALNDLTAAADKLPRNSPLRPLLADAMPALVKFSTALDDAIAAAIPRALVSPCRARREQRILFAAVRRFVRLPDNDRTGPPGLARFLVALLGDGPRVPAQLPLDSETLLGAKERRKAQRRRLAKWHRAIVHKHLGPPRSRASQKSASDLQRILFAFESRKELRTALLRLADDAARRKKGWAHLRAALEDVFKLIAHEPSDAERFRDFELMNFPMMRKVTQERRNQLLRAELGNDPDLRVRDLTPTERLRLAARVLKTKKPITFKDGKSASESGYRRVRKSVQAELA